MSTEQGFQSRGGARRHTKMRRAGNTGARQAITTEFTIPEPSAREVEQKRERSRLRMAAWDVGEESRRIRILEEWLDGLCPLARENAELLIRQREGDRSAAERELGYDDWADEEPDPDLSGFLHAVHFDRPDDVWMLRAARGRGHRFKNRGQ